MGFVIEKVTLEHSFDIGEFNINIDTSTLLTILLIIVMTFSLDNLKFDKDRVMDKRIIIDSIIQTFLINAGITILIALAVSPLDDGAYYGFAMLAAVPCAISVITGASLCNNNQDVAIAAVTCTYLAGIVLTTLITYLAVGNAVSPSLIIFSILTYIIVPTVLSFIIKRMMLKKWFRQIVINIAMALIVFLSVNKNKDIIFDEPTIALILLAIAVARIMILHIISKWYVSKRNIDKDSRMTFFIMGVWKNTSMAIAMTMTFLGGYPMAVIACVSSLIIEDIWFPWITTKGDIFRDAEPQ